jgi:LytS/YehU family sensor histidine kinase
MMLLPLVDHAVVHGLRPGLEGGTLRIVVKVTDQRLRLSILDSGGGFVHGADGAGIASIRERLEALYGDDGRLELARLDDGGTEARLELPCEARVTEKQDV